MAPVQIGERRQNILDAALIVGGVEGDKVPHGAVSRSNHGFPRLEASMSRTGRPAARSSLAAAVWQAADEASGSTSTASATRPSSQKAGTRSPAPVRLNTRFYAIAPAPSWVSVGVGAPLHRFRPLRRKRQPQGFPQQFGSAGIALRLGHPLPLLEYLCVSERVGR